ADTLVERQVNVVDGGCWQLPDGQVRCRADKRDEDELEKRQKVVIADGGCWQLADGQVQCRADKRDEDELEKRQRIADGGCWQIPNGQIRCKADKPRKPPGKRDEDELEKRQKIVIADGGCWQLPDGQVRCRADKDKRDGLTETATSVAPTQTATAADATATTLNSDSCLPGCVCKDDGSMSCTGPGPFPWDQTPRVECIDYPMARDCGYPEGREDGRCGLREFEKATCDPQGPFGGCCSSHGWCGNTTDHCGAGFEAIVEQ
ncbi:MAG: hypothetical protein Q9205_004216, partial [Flavoplaca limonia]